MSRVNQSINVIGHNFDGPFNSAGDISDTAGVYVVLDDRAGKWIVIDVGESGQLRTRLATHERASCWVRNCHGAPAFAVMYMPGSSPDQRREIESWIRRAFNTPCGKI